MNDTIAERGAIPAFINEAAGSAERARAALEGNSRFALQVTPPDQFAAEIRRLVAAGMPRVLVCGGDGTIRTAAAAVAGSMTELAIIPGGTLNHFAKAHDIPTEVEQAIAVAAGNTVRTVDVGYVNGRIFLNTSSAGAYVRFVRTREKLERWAGYHLASVAAAITTLVRFQVYTVEIEADGSTKQYRTPLVFAGVGERELAFPQSGAPIPSGQRALHVMVARAHTRLSLLRAAVRAAVSGRKEVTGEGIDAFIVDRCRIAFSRRHGYVAADGELVALTSPLEYSIARDALRIVTGG